MLDFYAIQDERLVRLEPVTETAEAAWIDLLNPTPDEETKVERLLGIDVPTREEMAEIEISSRLYRENDALYMTASLIVGGDGPVPQTCPVTFIIAAGRLITVRYAEPSVFRAVPRQAQKADSNLKGADGIFIVLLEAVIDRTADLLEKAGGEMDAISRTIFQNEVEKQTAARDYKAVLRILAVTATNAEISIRNCASAPRRSPPISARSPTTPPTSPGRPYSCSMRCSA